MLLSKLLRAATLQGRDSQEVVADFLASHDADVAAALRQQGAQRASLLGSDPIAAAAAGQGLQGYSSSTLSCGRAGRRNGSHGAADPQCSAAESQYLSSLGSLLAEDEVQLPLARAQTILRQVPLSSAVPAHLPRETCCRRMHNSAVPAWV
jgi:hypothetical protein